MSDVTVLGLGAMGAALAGTLLSAGREVTVWNRSPENTIPLVALGADAAPDLPAALGASSVILICVIDYDATRKIIEQAGAAEALRGRTVVQLSTGTPREAREGEALFSAHGARYLDGAIEVWPQTIGKPEAQILLSGPAAAFEECKPLLGDLAGDLRYLGPAIGAAAALDLAFLSRLMGVVFGAIHGAYICETEGIGLDDLAAVYPPGDRSQYLLNAIQDGFRISGGGASVEVAEGAISRLRNHAHDAGINSEFPDFLMSLISRAVAAGFGHEETAAVIKILRGTNSPESVHID